MTVEALA